jgi:hypothetical protein
MTTLLSDLGDYRSSGPHPLSLDTLGDLSFVASSWGILAPNFRGAGNRNFELRTTMGTGSWYTVQEITIADMNRMDWHIPVGLDHIMWSLH